MRKTHFKNTLILIIGFIIFSHFCVFNFKNSSSDLTLKTADTEVNDCFKPFTVYGKINTDTRCFKAGDITKIFEAEKGKYYITEGNNEKRITIPWEYLDVIENTENVFACTKDDIEAYANEHFFKSKTDFLIWTDLNRLKTYVLKKSLFSWHLIKEFTCSAGSLSCPTPLGMYEVIFKTKYVGEAESYICKNALCFYKDYMFHSVVFDKEGNYVTDGRLGERISSGCIRLSPEDSFWLFSSIPNGTPVYIN